MLGSLILYIKGMRILMFQLSGFYCMPAGWAAPGDQLMEAKNRRELGRCAQTEALNLSPKPETVRLRP